MTRNEVISKWQVLLAFYTINSGVNGLPDTFESDVDLIQSTIELLKKDGEDE